MDLLPHPWVLILEGRVAHAATARPEGVPEGIPVFRGGWLVEPLADAHVHLFLPGSFLPEERKRVVSLSRDAALERILGLLERYRRRGIAAVRDGGDPGGLALEAGRIAAACPGTYAAVCPAGEPVFPRGGYGTFLGRGVADAAEARELLARNRRAGATQAKILATGLNSLDRAGRVGAPQFSPADFQAIVDAASELGLSAMVHANGSLADLLDGRRFSGTLEHGFHLPEADLKPLAGSGLAWTPTLAAWAELGRHPTLTPAQRGVVAATDLRHRREVEAGQAMGLPILAGSDAGTPGVDHGTGLLGEIRRLAGAGLTPAQALASSAYWARKVCSEALGRHGGGLEPGSEAGFVWLRRDPVENLETLSDPLGVWIGGAWTSLLTAEQSGPEFFNLQMKNYDVPN